MPLRLQGKNEIHFRSVTEQEIGAHVVVEESTQGRLSLPRVSGCHAGDDMDGFRDKAVMGKGSLRADVGGPHEAVGDPEKVREKALVRGSQLPGSRIEWKALEARRGSVGRILLASA